MAGKHTPHPKNEGMITKTDWAESNERLTAIAKNQPEYAAAQRVLKGMGDEDRKVEALMAIESIPSPHSGTAFAEKLAFGAEAR